RRVTVERVEINGTGQCIACRIENPQDIVYALQHESVASAQALIGWLDRKLVATICEALIVQVESRQTESYFRIRLGPPPAGGGDTTAVTAHDDSVDDGTASIVVVAPTQIGVMIITHQCRIDFGRSYGVAADARCRKPLWGRAGDLNRGRRLRIPRCCQHEQERDDDCTRE